MGFGGAYGLISTKPTAGQRYIHRSCLWRGWDSLMSCFGGDEKRV